jgi:2-iminobutanoate/2-iminopropanoate deaminase
MTAPLPLRPAVAAGEWLAVSGQVGIKDGALAEGVQAQSAQALANLRAVIEANGATLQDVVKTNVFLVTMDDFAAMNEEYAKVFATDPPARSAVAVHQLPLGAVVEIEAWVYRAQP